MENYESLEVLNPLDNVLFVVLLYKNENVAPRAPYDIEIMGKKMWEWVALAGGGARVVSTPCTEESDIIGLIKPFIENEKYVMVFYSDTPLLSKSTVLKLKRGYVFDADYLKNIENVLSAENKLFDGEEFEPIQSMNELTLVNEKIKNKILHFHLKNGVCITDLKSTFIDADVVIEKGVRIEQNNCIKGQTYIDRGVLLEPNNTIKNCIISSNVVVKDSYLSNSRISENMIVGPFDVVIDKSC